MRQSCPALCDSMDCGLPGSSVPGILHSSTRVGCHAFLQEIFPTQGSNLCLSCLLLWQAEFLSLAPPGKPFIPTIDTIFQFSYLCALNTWTHNVYTHVPGLFVTQCFWDSFIWCVNHYFISFSYWEVFTEHATSCLSILLLFFSALWLELMETYLNTSFIHTNFYFSGINVKKRTCWFRV